MMLLEQLGARSLRSAGIALAFVAFAATAFSRVRREEPIGHDGDTTADLIRKLAYSADRIFFETKAPSAFAVARRFYGAYFAMSRDDHRRPLAEFWYADLLWYRAAQNGACSACWDDAAAAFGHVVATAKVDAARMKEAAYATVLGWRNAIVQRHRDEPLVAAAAADARVRPLPEREQHFLAAIDVYLAYTADPDEIAIMTFEKGRTYYDYNHFEEAAGAFRDVFEHHRRHEYAEYAVNLLLDVYTRQEHWNQLSTLVDELEQDRAFLAAKDDLAARVMTIARARDHLDGADRVHR